MKIVQTSIIDDAILSVMHAFSNMHFYIFSNLIFIKQKRRLQAKKYLLLLWLILKYRRKGWLVNCIVFNGTKSHSGYVLPNKDEIYKTWNTEEKHAYDSLNSAINASEYVDWTGVQFGSGSSYKGLCILNYASRFHRLLVFNCFRQNKMICN